MNSLLPFLGAIFQSVSFTLDKAILSLKKTGYKTYLGLGFPLIFFFDLIIFLIFRPPVSAALFAGSLIWVFLGLIGTSIGTNILYYRALAKDTLSELLMLGLLTRLPVIIFSALTFPDERNALLIILALASSLAVIWSHWENHRFEIKKDTLALLFWFLLVVPLGAVLSKIILGSWSPIVLALFQDGTVALILGWLYIKESVKISRGAILFLLLTNLFSSAGWILYYVSIQRAGIIYTGLLFSLQPLLTYFAAVVFLKEGLNRKKVLAFLIVLGAVGVAQILKPF
ncbi:MAG: DMT family transporter [Candidatus Liptonbacteria bacterium]|nr:DMT family transporter [Candidatus Liptonbacteria bacterium]